MLTDMIKRFFRQRSFAITASVFPLMAMLSGCSEPKADEALIRKIYSSALEKPQNKLRVYHLGHSLVGRDMPLMLQQIAGEGHDHRSQLGWGASLKSHWAPDVAINGFEKENDHNYYEDVMKAVESGQYTTFILTEMVEIKDAIKYFDSAKYLTHFIKKIHEQSPTSRIYFYESWHHVNDEQGWINRLDNDYNTYWLEQIVDRALAKTDGEIPVYVIPVGQVMAELFKVIESDGGAEGLNKPEDIFARNESGELDPIHINDIGAYLVALVHYAVLYQQSPEGLPHTLQNAEGKPAIAPSLAAAELMQKVTWEVVRNDYRTGIKAYE